MLAHRSTLKTGICHADLVGVSFTMLLKNSLGFEFTAHNDQSTNTRKLGKLPLLDRQKDDDVLVER